jgi:hypothetical protein
MDATLLLLLGLIAPFAIALINKVKWSSSTKQLVAFGVSIVFAVLWLVVTGGIAGYGIQSLLAAVPAIYTLSQAVYEFFVKNIASKLEAATDKSAVVISPAPGENNVFVTSNETIQVAKVSDAPANVVVDSPIEITTNVDPETPEPRG